jgi:hypothetical protein
MHSKEEMKKFVFCSVRMRVPPVCHPHVTTSAKTPDGKNLAAKEQGDLMSL